MVGIRNVTLTIFAALFALALGAQPPAQDPSELLKARLPADVAARVLAKIAEARAQQLPAQALEHRALKFAAKGVKPESIEKSINEQFERMKHAKDAIEKGRGGKASDEEIEGGADVIRKGADGAQVSTLAKNAPSGRSLVVPLFVIGQLIDRGLPSDEALARVLEKLEAKASDQQLEESLGEVRGRSAEAQAANKPQLTGKDLAATKRAVKATTRGRPAGVPANGGKKARPTGKGKKGRS
jgi:hypothetical protein